jgi:integrase
MAKRTPGLQRRNGVWRIDKCIAGYGRLSESCRTGDLAEAERYLARRLEEIRQETVYGVRPTRTFAQAAKKYLKERQHLRAPERMAHSIKALLPFVGEKPIDRLHNDTLVPFIEARRRAGLATGTINKDLSVVRRILNLAARVWRDESGLSWLSAPPLIQMMKGPRRRPYPLSWDEQTLLFKELPDYLARMCLFKVNAGLREQEVCRLRWDWEIRVPELETSVFVIPGFAHKNGEDRLVVLNRIATSVIEEQRGKHRHWVFAYDGRPFHRLYCTAWKNARVRASKRHEVELECPCPDGFKRVRIHDLKHTFGHRLRAAGVSLEDRQDLLGHKSDRITTHYSAPDIARLVEAANKVCEQRHTVLRVIVPQAVTQKSRTKLTQRAGVARVLLGD